MNPAAPAAARSLPLQKLLPFVSLIVLFVGLTIASPHFLTATNLSSVVRQTAVINIMALGMTIIIIAGGIDLSVGAILAFGGLLGTMAMSPGDPNREGQTTYLIVAGWGILHIVLPRRSGSPRIADAIIASTAAFAGALPVMAFAQLVPFRVSMASLSAGLLVSVFFYRRTSFGAFLVIGGLTGAVVLEKNMPAPVGVAVGIAAGLLCGWLNGYLVARLKIAPFIVTLGTLGIFRGATLIISNGLPVHDIPRSFAFLGEGNLLFVPFVLWLLIACAVAMHFILDHTRLGRYAFAIGSNTAAAVYAGIPVDRYTLAVYAIGGMLAGLSGMIEASRLMTGQPTAGQGYELQVIAAVVIGGGSLTGGEGSVVGTLIGAFVMGLLSNGSDLLGISPYVQQVVIGAVIVLAVTVDEVRKRRGTG